ncbi:MAG: hypothetical protein LBT05_07400 [Planctomycetaceae bacterium]|nr:hypothetical protein [Planctomycetaceae bacterium]
MREKLAQIQPSPTFNDDVLKQIKELMIFWNDYRSINDVRNIDFWRPDSWDRWESLFSQHTFTKVLEILNI